MGLRVPEIVFMELDNSFARLEPDEEIQDLLKFSVGLNLGLHYLSGAITYDPSVSEATVAEASRTVLLDSLITNIDRTHRNPNLLNWHKELWLIDHGASLYFHHAWPNWQAYTSKPFPNIDRHVLLSKATGLEEAALHMRQSLTTDVVGGIIAVIPDDWLTEAGDEESPDEKRKVYHEFLMTRLSMLDTLTQQAHDAHNSSL